MTQPVEDRWVVTAPQDIDFTPAEIAQIAEALRHLTTALPGRTPMVVLAQRRSDTRLGISGGAVVKEIVLPDREAPPSVEDRLRGAIYEASNYYRATKIVRGHRTVYGNVFRPHEDRKTGQPCPGIPLPGWPTS